MVREVNSEPAAQDFTEEANIALGLLGVVIADHPEKVRKLLRLYGIETRIKPTAKELTSKVLFGIETKGERFQLEIAKLISEKLPKKNQYHSYEGDGEEGADIPQEEDGYINLIMGAIAGIGSAIGGIKGKKQKRAEASQKTMSTLFAYKAQQEQIVADKAAQEKAQANKMAWLKGAGILVIVGLVGWVLVKQANKKPQLQPAKP